MSKLFKSAFIVSSMTLISRISGLIRDMVFATMLGSGVASDVFFVAFRIPNLFRRIFAEGAFSLAFVPVFSEYHSTKTDLENRDFLNVTATYLALATFLVTVLGVIFSPYVVRVIGMGFYEDAEKFQLTVDSLRWTFPYLFFISLTAMSAGILNTYEKFAAPAFTPVLLNLCLIMAAVFFVPLANEMQVSKSVVLAISVFIAGLIQFLFQIPFLKKQAILPKPSLQAFSKKQPKQGVKKVAKLMIPTIFGASVAQVNIMINTIIATFLATGSVSWLYYSDRLVEFPLGMIGIAISSVILPSLSRQHAKSDPENFSHLLNWGLKLSLVIVMPAMFGLFALSESLLSTLFQYNAFTVYDVHMSAQSLRAYSLGLVALVMVKILAPGFYARQDTKTPVKIAVVTLIVNSVSAIILVQFMNHAGLALAVSIASWLNAILLASILFRQKVLKLEPDWFIFVIKVLIASVIMSICLYYLNRYCENLMFFSEQSEFWQRFLALMFLVIFGMLMYLMTIMILKIRLKQLMHEKQSNKI